MDRGALVINPIVYSEVVFDFDTIEAVDALLPAADYEYAAILREATFLAARCHARRYRSYFPGLALIAPKGA